MPTDFDKREYWHERFSSETGFEWLVDSTGFMTALHPHLSRLPRTARIMHLGCGTSDLQNHLRSLGFLDVTNVDYEPLAIERGGQLEAREFGDVKMRYIVADATALDPDQLCGGQPFDLVVDKSTADAISCGGEEALRRMVIGVRGCLSDQGRWLSLSYSSSRFSGGAPPSELPFHVEVAARIPTPKLKEHDPDIYHWCYLLTPRGTENAVVSAPLD